MHILLESVVTNVQGAWLFARLSAALRAALAVLRRPPAIWLGCICGLILVAAMAAGTGALLSHLRDRALEEKKRELQNLAVAVAEQTDRTYQAIELVQQTFIARIRELGINSRADFERQMSGENMHRKLKDLTSGLPFVAVICLTNLDGKLINFSRFWPLQDTDVSERDYVKALTSDAQTLSFISSPLLNPTTGKWTTYLARKIVAPNGEVLGLIGTGIDVQYFENFFASILLQEHGSISLFRGDGVLLTRHPNIEGTVGKTFSLFLQALEGGKDRGTVRLVGRMDGMDRLLAVQRVPHYPMIISIGVNVAAALAEWRRAALNVVVAALLILVVVGGIITAAAWRVANRFRRQTTLFNAAISHMSHGLCMFDAQQRLLVGNDRYAQIYGLPPEKVRPGTTFREIIEHRIATGMFAGGNTEEYISERLAAVRETTADARVQQLPSGHFIAINHQPMEGGGWVATHEDVTERHTLTRNLAKGNEILIQKERELGSKNVQLDAALNNMAQGLIMFDAQRRLVVANRRYSEIYALPPELMVPGTASGDILEHGMKLGAFNHEWCSTIADLVDSCLALNRPLSSHAGLPNGRVVEIKVQPLESGGWVATHEDVTEERRTEAKILHMACHDSLTNLPNRTLLGERLEAAISQIQPNNKLALHFIDLDHFKTANDTLGHAVGDKLLQAVADRLQKIAKPSEIVARLGGDEFAVVQTGVDDLEDVIHLAQALIANISDPYDVDGHQISIGASIGISLAPDDGGIADQLLRNADLALYRAKADGRGTYHFFERFLDDRMQERRALEEDLRKALGAGQFELYYQPLVALDTLQIVACEALIRWHHPERGTISPADFVPLAEETGLIVPIGEWIIRQACETAAGWPDHIKVAVNLSAVQFRRPGLLNTVSNALAAAQLAPHRLELEITESLLLEASESVTSTLHQLRSLGSRIALDDFGTGYSSLSYLQSFPFDKIKIDRSFTRGIVTMQSSTDIVQAMVSLARALNMAITAEGVETEAQLRSLRENGCTEAQGYFISPPRPAENIERLFQVAAAAAVDAA